MLSKLKDLLYFEHSISFFPIFPTLIYYYFSYSHINNNNYYCLSAFPIMSHIPPPPIVYNYLFIYFFKPVLTFSYLLAFLSGLWLVKYIGTVVTIYTVL